MPPIPWGPIVRCLQRICWELLQSVSPDSVLRCPWTGGMGTLGSAGGLHVLHILTRSLPFEVGAVPVADAWWSCSIDAPHAQTVQRSIEDLRVECPPDGTTSPDIVQNMFGAASTFNDLFDKGYLWVDVTTTAVSNSACGL